MRLRHHNSTALLNGWVDVALLAADMHLMARQRSVVHWHRERGADCWLHRLCRALFGRKKMLLTIPLSVPLTSVVRVQLTVKSLKAKVEYTVTDEVEVLQLAELIDTKQIAFSKPSPLPSPVLFAPPAGKQPCFATCKAGYMQQQQVLAEYDLCHALPRSEVQTCTGSWTCNW